METNSRLELFEKSRQHKKLAPILDNRDVFEKKINTLKHSLPAPKPFIDGNQNVSSGDVNDISVCVRVRPLLEHEKEAKMFSTITANHPQVVVTEPRFSVKGIASVDSSTFNVDFAFGPDHSTNDVYECVGEPIVDMGLQGGVSTIFAYGQTASGKTFTISGILNNLLNDLLRKRSDHLELYLSLYEILGNATTDLLGKEKDVKVDIVEDKFGKVVVKNIEEIKIESLNQCLHLIESGMAHRKTATTFKNDTSSRSHAICQIRVVNTLYKSMEDGNIFVVDLAGSENASDSQFHGKAAIAETQAINSSLMALKDCIRNRALAAVNVDKFYHVPYRSSKLTLLLKNAFEMESRKLCKTVVIANVAPSVIDISMSLNTLRYVAPLKIGQAREKVKPNPKNPANWSHEELINWAERASKNQINVKSFCPYESGMQILKIPEASFVERVIQATDSKWGEKRATEFYTQLWSKLIDARTQDRKKKMKSKDGLTLKQRKERNEAEKARHLMERMKNETDDKNSNPDKYKSKQDYF